MTVSIVAKNTAQGLSAGSIVATGSFTVTSGGLIVHTVPAGRRQKLRYQYVIRVMTTAHRIRFRIGALDSLVDEKGTGIVAPPAISTDLGEYTLNAGERVQVGSGNVATEGATCLVTISILEDLPA